MKRKDYQKPTMNIVKLQHQTQTPLTAGATAARIMKY